MHVVITGADGFVGTGLSERLIRDGAVLGAPISRLTLVDRAFQQPQPQSQSQPDYDPGLDVRSHRIIGDLGDPQVLDRLLAIPPDLVFHLASMPGAQAEREFDDGVATNLTTPTAVALRLAEQGRLTGVPPRVVFASSIAVYGPLGPGDVDELAVPRPALSYGAHKLIIEVLLADLTRRGEIDARSLRLPGIVARPPTESGHGSAFMSQLFHVMAAGRAYACPVSTAAQAWWMSRERCIDNLIHAAVMPPGDLAPERVWQLPVLRASVGALIDALGERFGSERRAGVTFAPDERIEMLFGRLPALHAPRALAAGFRADTDLDSLITAALAPPEPPSGTPYQRPPSGTPYQRPPSGTPYQN